MEMGGWIMMALSIGFVLALNIYCFGRILRTPRAEEHLHAPLEIDTKDKDT
jgi:hypothetical protein